MPYHTLASDSRLTFPNRELTRFAVDWTNSSYTDKIMYISVGY